MVDKTHKDHPDVSAARARREARMQELKELRGYSPKSNVDPKYPEEGNATTESVRDNFGYTKYEIEALQAAVQTLGNQINAIDAEYVNKLGDTMLDNLSLDPRIQPTKDEHYVTKGYVDSTGGGGGLPEAPQDGDIYGRKDAQWVAVPTGGGGTSGPVEWSTIQNKPQEIEALDGTVGDSLVSGGSF
jgi:hypothetical protein